MNQFRFRPVGSGFDMRSAVMNLIIINVIFFIAKYSAASRGIDLDRTLGLYHPLSPEFHWWQIGTHMFMHGGFRHLLYNMLGLYFFGRMLENVWGTKRFLIFYFICGLGAALVHLGWETFSTVRTLDMYYGNGWSQLLEFANNSNMVGEGLGSVYSLLLVPMVGASGAVFGLLMGAALLFPNTTFYVYFAIPVKLKWLALIYALIEFGSGFGGAQDNVAHFAHIGGMIFGFILVQFYKRSRNNFY